jgi:hexosaminidase
VGRSARKNVPDEEAAYRPQEFRFAPSPARFVRVRARNVGICPSWHPGAGEKCWVFIDEIVVG